MSTVYTCEKCGLEVIVIDGHIVPACTCKAPIVGQMSSNLKGSGGLKT